MPAQKNNNAAGLWISPSPLQAPVGAYILADNCVINYNGIIESRRGFSWLPYNLSVNGSIPKTMFGFGNYLMVQSQFKLYYNSGSALVPYSATFIAPNPDVLRMKSQEVGLSVYFTNFDGVQGLDNVTNQPRLSGLPIGPLPNGIGDTNQTRLTGAAGSGWMPADSQSAYVTTFFRTDSNEKDYEGTPSGPIYVSNPVSITIPATGAGTGGSLGNNVGILYSNSGLVVGDVVTITFNPADTAFNSGPWVVSAVTPTLVTLSGAGTAGPISTTANPATIVSDGRSVQVNVSIPRGVSAGDTVLVYRTFSSGAADVQPPPQYYLDKEYVVDATDILNGYFTYLDDVPDALLQDPLYTNTDDGQPADSSPQNDNGRPPWCQDLALFDNRLWGANYAERQTLPISLLGIDAPNGLQVGDTITINGVVFTGINELSPIGANQFRVFVSGSPQENVRWTAQELSLVIRKSSSAQVDAFYTSTSDEIQGAILLSAVTNIGDEVPTIAVTVSRPSAWSPIMDIATPTYSRINKKTNGLWFSKQNEPESVPLLNRLAIGPENCKIVRIRPLRDKLFVFTDTAGVFYISNTYPYQITALSATAVLNAPDTLVNFDDAIYALTTQGVARFTEAGPEILSIPIETELRNLFTPAGLSVISVQAFAVGYESYRKYILAMPQTTEDTKNQVAWVYDVTQKCWTRWLKPLDFGYVLIPTDTFYVTTPETDKVSVERRNFNRTDYADEDWQVNIDSFTGQTVQITSTTEPAVGGLLLQSEVNRSIVTAVESTGVNTYEVTTLDTVEWTPGTATWYPGIPNTLLNTPLFASGPEERKNFREVTYHFRTPGFSLGKALFAGDTNPAIVSVDFEKGGWGAVSWGLFAWLQPGRPVNKRVSVSTGARRVSYFSVGFSLCEAQAQWQLMGITPIFENMSERNTK